MDNYDKYNVKVIIEPSHYPNMRSTKELPALQAIQNALKDQHPAFKPKQITFHQTTGIIDHGYGSYDIDLGGNKVGDYDPEQVVYKHTTAFLNYLIRLNVECNRADGHIPDLDRWLPAEVLFDFNDECQAVLNRYCLAPDYYEEYPIA